MFFKRLSLYFFYGNFDQNNGEGNDASVIYAHGRLNEMCQQADGRPGHE